MNDSKEKPAKPVKPANDKNNVVFNGESKISVEDMAKVRTAAGQSSEKQKNAATKYESTPANDTFKNIGTKTYSELINEVTKKPVVSVGLYTVGGHFVSENCLNQQNLLPEFKVIKGGSRKDRVMLKSVNLTDLSKFGSSADERLIALQGKAFTTVKNPETRVYKTTYLDKTKFDEVCYDVETDANLKDALSKTETKNGYVFTF